MISRGKQRPNRRDVLHEASTLTHRLAELSDELTEFARALDQYNRERAERSEDDKGASGDA